jgi:hypothetical protein
MEHLNTGIEGVEVNDIKGEGSVRRLGLGGYGMGLGGEGRLGCIDSGSVWGILRSVWIERFWVFRAVRNHPLPNPFRSRRGCFRAKLADDRVLPTWMHHL